VNKECTLHLGLERGLVEHQWGALGSNWQLLGIGNTQRSIFAIDTPQRSTHRFAELKRQREIAQRGDDVNVAKHSDELHVDFVQIAKCEIRREVGATQTQERERVGVEKVKRVFAH
jgi:hypothetical protein